MIRPLFEDFAPYVGYRCLAAMALTRPILVANLNWDSALKTAAEQVGLEPHCFDLAEVERGREAVEAVRSEGRGIACAHVHGILDSSGSKIRFSRPHTLSFKPAELVLLSEILDNFTIVAGTSLAGPQDAHQLLSALSSPEAGDGEVGGPEPLWVFERGPHANAPGFKTEVAVGLSKALLARNSIDNFTCNPDVDFDLLLATLRAAEIGLPWQGVVKEAHAPLPDLRDLIPPDPAVVRGLLDRDRTLMVGAPRLGASTLAYLVAWWHCLIAGRRDGEQITVKGCQGANQLLGYLGPTNSTEDNVGMVVADHLFEDGGTIERDSAHQRLAEALGNLGSRRLIATGSPDGTIAALCGSPSQVKPLLEPAVLSAGTLWRRDDLRAWARARGGERGELVCREIRSGLVSTPSQAMRTRDGNAPLELDEKWRARLLEHLRGAYDPASSAGLLLAMLRLQDFSVPQVERRLELLSGADAACLLGDPWGLCFEITVDGQTYLRLGHPGIVEAIDEWLASGAETVAERLEELGESAHWASSALSYWRSFVAIGEGEALPDDLEAGELELYGTELVRRALQARKPAVALAALRRTWEVVHDQWTAKDVAFDLVLNWEVLKDDPGAVKLRDELLSADEQMGTYALFEAMLRAGRPTPIEIWNWTSARLLDLARLAGTSEFARRQVALAFDAMLWRPCPVAAEQEKKLLVRLLDVAGANEVLNIAFAAACAYHHQGVERLRQYRLRLPSPGVDLTEAQALEVAWIVEWHFVHQSRCRAMASRRTFLSTVGDPEDTSAPRYLDRIARPYPLDPEQETAVVLMAEALLRRPETAGWALHLIMNVQATMGTFTVPDVQIKRLNELLCPEAFDDAVLSAIITYAPSASIKDVVSPVLDTDFGAEKFQQSLGAGVTAASTRVCEPRFCACSDPWAVRNRWHAFPKQLPFGISEPLELVARLQGRLEEAVAIGLITRDEGEAVLTMLRRGDTYAAEVEAHERKLGPGDDLALLVHLCGYVKARNERAANSAG